MTISDETLMAYADGEVDAATGAIVEAAMQDDPTIRARIAEHRALRSTVRAAFSGVLDEAVPQRLIDAARGRGAAVAGNVVNLAQTRSAAAMQTRVSHGWRHVVPAHTRPVCSRVRTTICAC